MGDFNAIRWHLKAFSGAPVPNGMREFGIAIREVDLVKPSVQGNWFIWTSKVHEPSLLRCLSSSSERDWLSAWPSLRVIVLLWGISYHSPILLYHAFQ